MKLSPEGHEVHASMKNPDFGIRACGNAFVINFAYIQKEVLT